MLENIDIDYPVNTTLEKYQAGYYGHFLYPEMCRIFALTSEAFYRDDIGHGYVRNYGLRTPLFREFTADPNPGTRELDGDEVRDLHKFRAVGSLVGSNDHRPMIDADYGAHLEDEGETYAIKGDYDAWRSEDRRDREFKKVTLALGVDIDAGASSRDKDLAKLFRDLGWEMEIQSTDRMLVEGNDRASRTLRIHMPEDEVAVINSISKGCNHVFIQRTIPKREHQVFLKGLTRMGVISSRWAFELQHPKFGTVLRTPWTSKNISAQCEYDGSGDISPQKETLWLPA